MYAPPDPLLKPHSRCLALHAEDENESVNANSYGSEHTASTVCGCTKFSSKCSTQESLRLVSLLPPFPDAAPEAWGG